MENRKEEEKKLRGLIGDTVRLTPFELKEGTKNWLYYNWEMSNAVNKISPYVKIQWVEWMGDHYELICKFADGHSRYIMYDWIDFTKGYCLFV